MTIQKIKRHLYECGLSSLIKAGTLFPSPKTYPRVFYGGAFSGTKGGPRVKTGLLQQAFPQHLIGFNLVYLLSGALYLSKKDLSYLKDKEIPIILNQNGVGYPLWTSDWQKMNDHMAYTNSCATHVFYQSEFCRRAAQKWLGVTPSSSEILYNGVDTNFFCPSPKKEVEDTPFTFLYTGVARSHNFYRLENMVQGLAKARKDGLNICLKFAGIIPDVMQKKLSDLIHHTETESSFYFSGPYNRQQLPTILNQADAYITLAQNDCCPNAVLEAMACGLPILYNASGGVPELVGDTAGVGIPIAETFDEIIPVSPLSISEGMAKIIQNKDSFAREARVRAEDLFSLTNWLQRHKDIFEKQLGGAP